MRYIRIEKKIISLVALLIISLSIGLKSNIKLINNKYNIKEPNGEKSIENNNKLIVLKASDYWDENDVSFIHILNNWTDARDDLDWVQGGDGSLTNPFYIENVTINAANSPTGCGILIQNTDEYFYIKNCKVYNAIDDPNAGIRLINVANFQLENNTLFNNEDGIRLDGCNSFILKENTVYENVRNGIFLLDSNNSNTIQNVLYNNGDTGINLARCVNISISENSADQNAYAGINQYKSYRIGISSNYVSLNGKIGIGIGDSNYSIVFNNIALSNHEYSGMHLSNCNNIHLEGNIANENDNSGIGLYYCSFILINKNTANNNGAQGIYLSSSSNINIMENHFNDNEDHGIYLGESDDNIIEDNEVEDNEEDGIGLHDSDDNKISENKVKSNEKYGIGLHDNSDDNKISENEVEDNDNHGIGLHDSDDNTIEDNEVEDNNGHGIGIHNSDDNTIEDNDVKGNSDWGIWLEESDNNEVKKNDLRGNVKGCVTESDCEGNDIRDNRCDDFTLTWEILLVFIVVMVMLVVVMCGLIGLSDKKQKKKQKKLAKSIEILKEILSVSDRIQLERVKNIINLDSKIFDEKINEWAKKFGFKIDGAYLITQGESIDAFISTLEKQFTEWEQMEKIKEGKVETVTETLPKSQELEKIKADLNKSVSTIETLIQTKDFLKAINELETVRTVAKNHNIVETISWAENNLDLCKNLIFKNSVLELGEKFGLIQTKEISKATQIQDEKLIVNLIQKMIKNKEINAVYFSKSKLLVFNQELEKIKTDLEGRIFALEKLIQTKEFTTAIDELENVRNIAKQYNFEDIISWVDKNLVLYSNLRKNTKKDIQKRYRMAKKLIREKKFSVAIKEFNNIIEQAKFQKFEKIIERSTNKLLTCQELEKIKADLERSVPTIENLIQTKDFLKAINELRTIRTIAKQHNFKDNIRWIDNNLDLCRNLIIKKTVLELGVKFGRIQTQEISERTNIKDEKLIIKLIQEMIENKEIYAEFFSSSKSLLFNQDTKIEEIDKLMETYKEWEEKKKEKKI